MLIMLQELHFAGILDFGSESRIFFLIFFFEEFWIIVGKWAAWRKSAPSEFSNIQSIYK